ncbi:MAG TPA: hypothetical protein VGM59_14945 [Dongiaceae bacterium]
MSVQYLLVVFDGDDCDVLADGDLVGVTNHTLMLPANEYEITLDSKKCTPKARDVVLSRTSLVRPKVVIFSKT